MIKVEAVYIKKLVAPKKYENRFDHFKATIGCKVYEPIPIGFLRISELGKLQEMLETAYEAGYEAALINSGEETEGV
jgi:hypothetical protein